MQASSRRPGRVVTFYSYKGGTGRSMALSNVAWILASAGKRVLVIDWDLEAPGLHRYFRPFLVDAELTSSDGLIDLVDRYAGEAIRPPPDGSPLPPDWWLPLADIGEHVVGIGFDGFPAGGRIDLLPAGRQCESYAVKVSAFNWQNFYDRLGGGGFLDAVRRQARAEYDYVLIDSRTGVSDTAGICTAQMPDTLVVCFTYNNQSVKGAAAVAESARQLQGTLEQQRRAAAGAAAPNVEPLSDTQRPYRILPVPMRVDAGESDRLALRQAFARAAFAQLLGPGLVASEPAAYWAEVEVPHRVFYAYEEVLAPLKDDAQDPKTVLAAFVRLTREITQGEVAEYRLPLAPERRQQLLDAYAETPQTAGARQARAPVAQESADETLQREFDSALLSLDEAERTLARAVLCRLVRLGEGDEGGGAFAIRVPLQEFDAAQHGVVSSLARRGLVTVGTESASRETLPGSVVALANERIVGVSNQLRQWLADDREFLLWRQQLRTYRRDWDRTGEKGALLSGPALTDARQWVRKRPDDLNALERLFIDTSIAEADVQAVALQSPVAPVAASPMRPANAGRMLDAMPAPPTAAPARGAGSSRSRWLLVGLVLVALPVTVMVVSRLTAPPGRPPIDEAKPAPKRDVPALLAAAEQQFQAGNVTDADATYQQVLVAAPDNLQALLQLGRIRDGRGDFGAAADYYDRAIKAAPGSAQPYIERAASLTQQGRFEAAWADLNTAIEKDPNSALAYYNRGVAQENLKRPADALRDYNEALKRNVALVPALLRRAALQEKSNPAAARTDYRTVLLLPDENNSQQTARLRLDALGAPESPKGKRPDKPASAAATNGPRVFIQFSDETDRPAAEALQKALARDLEGVALPGVERVSVRSSGEVRYFFAADAELAGKVAIAATLALTTAGKANALPLGFRDAKDYPNTRPGTVEIWLPPLSVLPTQRGLRTKS